MSSANKHNTKTTTTTQDIPSTIHQARPEQWLQAKIDQYQARIDRLKAELAAAEIEQKGHQIWLASLRTGQGGE